MNFLELVRRTHLEAGISGDPPTSVATAVGVSAKVVEWVKNSWLDIQTLRNWNWAWQPLSLTIPAGECDVNLPTALSVGKLGRHGILFLSKPNSPKGSSPLVEVDVGPFQYRYPDRADAPARRPHYYSVAPNKVLMLDAKTDQDYVLRGEYYLAPQVLSNDGDIPTLPEPYHMIIVWRAVSMFANNLEYPNLSIVAGTEYRRWLARLEANELPPVTIGTPSLEDAYGGPARC